MVLVLHGEFFEKKKVIILVPFCFYRLFLPACAFHSFILLLALLSMDGDQVGLSQGALAP